MGYTKRTVLTMVIKSTGYKQHATQPRREVVASNTITLLIVLAKDCNKPVFLARLSTRSEDETAHG